MNARKIVAGMAIAVGGVILLTTVLFKDEIHDWLFAIRRVRTWGDLLAQRPIRLSDGVVVRLGIEDTRCPQGSGVLLYCLTEGYDPSSGTEVHEDALGPLDTSIVEEGRIVQEGESSVMGWSDLLEETAGRSRWLFARSIPAPRSGRYHVTVSEGGRTLRQVTVKATEEAFHPWLTLVRPQRPRARPQGRPLDEQKGPSLGIFQLCRGNPALPSRAGYTPFRDAGFRDDVEPTRRLPTLFPDPLAPVELELQNEKEFLGVSSRSKIRFGKENFAVRWWINGVPHVPLPSIGGLEERDGLSLDPGERIRLEFDFDLSGSYLRSGDLVSLQLMYSDPGWSLTDGGTGFFFFSEEHRILTSNRIELIVP